MKRPVKPTPELLAKALQPIDVAEAVLAVAKMPARATVTELHLFGLQSCGKRSRPDARRSPARSRIT